MMIDINEYIEFLLQEIKDRNEDLKIFGEQIKYTAPHLDPNWRLEQGKLFAIVKVVIDLCYIADRETPDGFYPDSMGFIDDAMEVGECTKASC